MDPSSMHWNYWELLWTLHQFQLELHIKCIPMVDMRAFTDRQERVIQSGTSPRTSLLRTHPHRLICVGEFDNNSPIDSSTTHTPPRGFNHQQGGSHHASENPNEASLAMQQNARPCVAGIPQHGVETWEMADMVDICSRTWQQIHGRAGAVRQQKTAHRRLEER